MVDGPPRVTFPRTAQLIQKYGPLDGRGAGMSRAALERFHQLKEIPPRTLDKAMRHELAGLTRQFENPELMKIARKAQEKGGVLAGHAVALTHVADSRDTCLCIRGVNPLATGLIEEGFGTKDMSIKAKSSNLPPLNGLIPFDQSYGKKGDDPAEVSKFNHKNEEAIRARAATRVDAKISMARLEFLESRLPGGLSVKRQLTGLAPNQILLVGNDFKSPAQPRGIDHFFIAEKHEAGQDAKLTIYPARQNRHGAWERGVKPVQVMANRMGKAVTADYDLALVAPRIRDLGPEHMSPLKMSSFAEVLRRTKIVTRYANEIKKLREEYVEAKQRRDVTSMVHVLRQFQSKLPTHDETKRATIESGLAAFQAGTLDGQLLSDLGRIAGEHEFLTKAVPEAMAKGREPYAPAESPGATGNAPPKDLGIVSKYVRDLIPELNETVGQTNGLEVFHHGDDCGNPFSVEADNFPMTVILPKTAAGSSPQIRVVETPDEFLGLVKDLKRQGYVVPINGAWNSRPELLEVRRESFTKARNAVAAAFNSPLDQAQPEPDRPQPLQLHLEWQREMEQAQLTSRA